MVFYTPADGADFLYIMMAHRTNVAMAGSARKYARGAVIWLLLASPMAALPVVADVALYQAVVPLKGTAEPDRAAALGEALKFATVRASGRRDAGAAPAVVKAAADPAPYVQQYSTTAERMLKVGFDGRAMEQLLQQAGLPLWPAERPATTVFLFVVAVDGAARAVTAAERPPERLEIERAAAERGVPLDWPVATVDLASARASTAAAGTKGAVLVCAPAGGGYDWTFGHAGQTTRSKGGLAAGPDLAADALASRYAPGSTKTLKTIPVRVGGIDDVRAYAALTSYLEGLSLVRAVALRGLAGSAVQFDLDVRGDLELLRRIIALDGRLVPAPAPGAASEAPDFLWQP